MSPLTSCLFLGSLSPLSPLLGRVSLPPHPPVLPLSYIISGAHRARFCSQRHCQAGGGLGCGFPVQLGPFLPPFSLSRPLEGPVRAAWQRVPSCPRQLRNRGAEELHGAQNSFGGWVSEVGSHLRVTASPPQVGTKVPLTLTVPPCPVPSSTAPPQHPGRLAQPAPPAER